MEDFLRGLYGALPSWARVLSNPITSRMIAIYNWVFGLFRATIYPWSWIANGAIALRQGILELGYHTYYTLWWIRNVWVPMIATATRNAAIQVATYLVTKAVYPALKGLADLRSWAIVRVTSVVRSLDLLRRWAETNIRGLILRLISLERRLFSDWATPGRLSAWLVGAMWSALWGYGWGQVDKIADYLWRRRQAILLRGVAEVERQIGRLL